MVLAVHELAANVVVHGGGVGRLRVWKLVRELRRQVEDGDLMASLDKREGRDGNRDTQSGGFWEPASVNSLPCEPGHGLFVVRHLVS